MMILITTQCFPSRLGGIESFVKNLALGLGKSNKVIVFADRYNITNDAIFDNEFKNQIIIKRTSGIKFFRRRKKIKEIKAFIESNHVKVVLADTWKSLELGADYLNEKKIPTICLAHGNEFLFNYKIKEKRIKKILSKVTCVVANSIFTMNLVKKIFKLQKKLIMIYPGAQNLSNFDKTEIFGITGDPILLTLARLEKRKGHMAIIDSVKKLISEFPNIQYVIAGIGSELVNLKKIVKEKKLQKNIIFVGQVNDLQKKFLFQKTKIMIMPTLDERQNRSIEGFGIVYIEAAFFRIPSIASNVGGTPEAVINNFTGKIVNNINDLYSTIRELLLDQNKITELGKNAQKRDLEEFSWDYVSKKYQLIIDKITKIN